MTTIGQTNTFVGFSCQEWALINEACNYSMLMRMLIGCPGEEDQTQMVSYCDLLECPMQTTAVTELETSCPKGHLIQ